MPRPLLAACAVTLAFAGACRREPAPWAPAGAPPAPAAAWGEAAGGLSLGLDAPKAAWVSGEPMTFGVRARNASTAPLRLARFEDGMWWHHVRLENLADGTVWVGGAGLFLDHDRSPDATLDPGAVWARVAELNLHGRRHLRWLADRKPGDDWDYRTALPPGRYRATVEYRHLEGGGGEAPRVWAGRAVSNAVEIVVSSG